MAGNAENALKAVTEFETVFNNAVAEEVKKTVRQNAPQASADGISNTDNYGSRLAQKAVRSSSKIIYQQLERIFHVSKKVFDTSNILRSLPYKAVTATVDKNFAGVDVDGKKYIKAGTLVR